MRWRQWVLVFSAFVMGGGFLVLFGRAPREPEYNGRKLSEWVDLVRIGTPPTPPEAEEAIRRMGSNALPWLLRWSLYDEPVLRTKLREWGQKLPRSAAELVEVSPPIVYRRRGWNGFSVLGDRAAPAVGTLASALAEPGRSIESKCAAVAALAQIGRDGVAPLVKVVAGQVRAGPGVTAYAIYYLGTIKDVGTNGPQITSALLPYLGDTNWHVVVDAVAAIHRLRLSPGVTIPALSELLRHSTPAVRGQAALCLGRFGGQAESAVPALMELLSDTNIYVHTAASNALLEIAPEREKGKVGGPPRWGLKAVTFSLQPLAFSL